MRVTFWGVRAAYPIARADNQRYGGNSTCVEIHHRSGQRIIMDAGSGIACLGRSLLEGEHGRGRGRSAIVFGHTHWDHILGFPFFEPFYVEGNRFEVYSAGQQRGDIESILGGQQLADNFPVRLDELASTLSFHTVHPGEPFQIGPIVVTPVQLNHPGLTLGYRFEPEDDPARAVVVYTDTARIRAIQQGDDMPGTPGFAEAYAQALRDHCRGAAVLVHDAHFDEVSIQGREHWGHSTARDALALAREAGVKHLVLFHHSPEHDDDHVDRILADARAAATGGVRVSAAVERRDVLSGPGGVVL